jgi:HEAT repeat protein
MNDRPQLPYVEPAANLSPDELVDLLGAPDPPVWAGAFKALEERGRDAIHAIRRGLEDPRWQVRRWCAALLDHGGGPESRPWLLPLLDDPMSKVRVMALHTLACDRCSGGENPVDAVPYLIDRLNNDESIKVRRMAAAMFAPLMPDPRIEEVCRELLAVETDRKLLLHAERTLAISRSVDDAPEVGGGSQE